MFLARSDPAMNYGQASAILMNKAALYNLQLLEEDTGVKMCPIIGVGSAPFRGNLKPNNVDRLMEEYPSVQTFTVQSAFKYDYSHDEVRSGIQKINEGTRTKAMVVDTARCEAIIEKCSNSYREKIIKLAPLINEAANYVPPPPEEEVAHRPVRLLPQPGGDQTASGDRLLLRLLLPGDTARDPWPGRPG